VTDIIDKLQNAVHRIADILDKLSGLSVVLAMLLVVLNVLSRTIFNKPIQGTYDYTGFLTALIIAFGISACLVSNSHIAIDFIVEKFHKKAQKVIGIVVNSTVFIFMSAFTYKLFGYAFKLLKNHEVSLTTHTPLYILIYIIAFCFVILSLVSLFKALSSFKEVV